MTPQHDFKGALEALNTELLSDTDAFEAFTVRNYETIRRALLIADKLMQEPKADVIAVGGLAAGIYNEEAELCFNAMRDELLKGIL